MDVLYKLFNYPTAPAAEKYHGLYNDGATCYLNSVLQVLFMTREFREAVNSFTENNLNTEGFIDPVLKDLFDALQRGTTYTYNILKALKIDKVYEQRDAAEYFEKILNLTNPDSTKIFHGQMTHRTTCSKCPTVKDTDGAFWHLPFELVDSCSRNYSVVDGIEKYFQPSYFTGDNQMYCDTCDCKVDASSKYVIKHHPDVLILLLKRFDFSCRSMSYVKISCDVDVPYSLNIPENQTYELYAVVDHFGGLRGGHYAATIKDDEDKWFSFDDSRVTPLDRSPFADKQNIARFANAYFLFYRKKVIVADIQEKINKPRKRSRTISTDEDEPTTKTTKHESDTADQENKTLLTNEDLREIKVPENIRLTNMNQMTPDVDPDVQPGDSEESADRQEDIRDEETEGTRITVDSREDMTSKDKNQDKDRCLSTGEVSKNTEEPEVTVIDQSRPGFKAGNRENIVSAEHDRQDDINDPQDRSSDGAKDDKQEEQQVKHEPENSVSSEEGVTSKDRNSKDLEVNFNLSSAGDETGVKDPDEAELTEKNQMTQAVQLDPKPGDSEEGSLLPAGHDGMSPAPRRPVSVTTGETKQTETTENSDRHEQEVKSKDGNTDDQEESTCLISTEVRNSEKSEQTETVGIKPAVDPDVKPGDTSADLRNLPGEFGDEETEGLKIQPVTINSIIHTKDMTVNNKDADDQEETPCDEGQDEIKSSVVCSERSAVCDRRGETSDPQEEETGETKQKHEAQTSGCHEKNIETSSSDQRKDKTQLLSEDQNKDQHPENVGLTQTERMAADPDPEPVSAACDPQDNNQTENSDSHEVRTSEGKEPDEAELTEIIQMTQTMKFNLTSGDSERPPLPAVHAEVSSAPRKQSAEQDMKSNDGEMSPQAEVKSPDESERTEAVDIKLGTSEKSTVVYFKTGSREEEKLLDEEIQPTAVSSDRSEQNVRTKEDDDDEVKEQLLCDKGRVQMMDVEGGAATTRCTRQRKCKIVMGILAVLLALIILALLFTVRM